MSCTEERDDLNQSLGQWREKVHSLEKTNCETRNLITILEDDIRAGRKEYEALQSSMEKLKTERQQVCTWRIEESGIAAQFLVPTICQSTRHRGSIVTFSNINFSFAKAVGAD